MAFARLTIPRGLLGVGEKERWSLVSVGFYFPVLDERRLAKLWLTRNTKEPLMEVLFITIKILPIVLISLIINWCKVCISSNILTDKMFDFYLFGFKTPPCNLRKNTGQPNSCFAWLSSNMSCAYILL